MLIIKTIKELKSALAKVFNQNKIGFVPTMGALHLGHESLIKRAKLSTDFVVVSIFVNPLQFGKNEDLAQYPRTLEKDQIICQNLGVNLLFMPSEVEMDTLQKDPTFVVPPQEMMTVMCGKYRPNHFQGVATIIVKLFNLIQPQLAFFGQKDAQQVAIIRRVVDDLFIPVKIISCPIIREKSGLALSSRNQYLSPQEKEISTQIYQSLIKAKESFLQGERKSALLLNLIRQELAKAPFLQLQYLSLVDEKTLQPLTKIIDSGLIAIAVYCGKTRLIDNLILTVKKPTIAIDGPAGAGKSTISRRLAQQLGLLYLDTGAMYRAITWLVMANNIPVDDESSIKDLITEANIELLPNDDLTQPVTVKVNGKDVTTAIRTPAVTAQVSHVASQKAVREKLVKLQQNYGNEGGIIAEGRDIGTNVFPKADLKVFLTASVHARARRRALDLQNQGQTDIDLTQLEKDIAQRDFLDSTRELAPLQQASDAIPINTDDLSIAEVTEKIAQLIRGC